MGRKKQPSSQDLALSFQILVIACKGKKRDLKSDINCHKANLQSRLKISILRSVLEKALFFGQLNDDGARNDVGCGGGGGGGKGEERNEPPFVRLRAFLGDGTE